MEVVQPPDRRHKEWLARWDQVVRPWTPPGDILFHSFHLWPQAMGVSQQQHLISSKTHLASWVEPHHWVPA